MHRTLLHPLPVLRVYSPFGVVLEGRSWNAGRGYRYGFQAQEQDVELWEGAVNYKYRVEDPRLGRFFSVDPLYGFFPWNSSYSFSENRVIDCLELEGSELIHYTISMVDLINTEEEAVNVANALELDGIARNLFMGYSGSASILFPDIGVTWNSIQNRITDPIVWFRYTAAFVTNGVNGMAEVQMTEFLDSKVKQVQTISDGGDKGWFAAGQLTAEVAVTVMTAKSVKSWMNPTQKAMVRENFARGFYEKFGENQIQSKLNGINFNKPVQTVTLPKGTKVQQWVGADGKVGKYFAPVGTDPNTCGINIQKKGGGLKYFELTEDVQVLKSTCADVAGSNGGGIQYFSPELQAKTVIIN
jgi:RHS repeat-associated protein